VTDVSGKIGGGAASGSSRVANAAENSRSLTKEAFDEHWRMCIEKPLAVGDVSFIANEKPVIVVFPDAQATEFSSVEVAREQIKLAALIDPFIQPARIFHFKHDNWVEV